VNPKTIISCAGTGGDDTAFSFPAVLVTPVQIAPACLVARAAGAAIVHIHVRNRQTGKPSIVLDFYSEVVKRFRSSGNDVIINFTTGPGAGFNPSDDEASTIGWGSNLRLPATRIRHIAALKPELEIFDTGHMVLANHLAAKGLFGEHSLFRFVPGVPLGAPATTQTMALFKTLVPAGGQWGAFGIGRHEFQMLAQALVLGGHVRVGFEDNLNISIGVLANSNA
jgi:hypothetical protein